MGYSPTCDGGHPPPALPPLPMGVRCSPRHRIPAVALPAAPFPTSALFLPGPQPRPAFLPLVSRQWQKSPPEVLSPCPEASPRRMRCRWKYPCSVATLTPCGPVLTSPPQISGDPGPGPWVTPAVPAQSHEPGSTNAACPSHVPRSTWPSAWSAELPMSSDQRSASKIGWVSGELIEARAFDMWAGDVNDLLKFIRPLHEGTLVFVASYDDPATKMNEETRKLFSDLGSKNVKDLAFRDSWVFVGAKGVQNKSPFEQHVKNSKHTNKYEGWPEALEMGGCIPRRTVAG
uniref:FAM3 metabolism regulating signaling molecule A n=1 Tax=Canis lupus familiaris TaxID=9615 RepID=A0A8I3Q3P3_CANLF